MNKRYKQPCPQCGRYAGWSRHGKRLVSHLFNTEGEVDDILEDFDAPDELSDQAVCRADGCGAILPLNDRTHNGGPNG